MAPSLAESANLAGISQSQTKEPKIFLNVLMFQKSLMGKQAWFWGIFFDDLNDRDPEKIFAFAEECLNNVVAAYVPIIEKHKNDSFTEAQIRQFDH